MAKQTLSSIKNWFRTGLKPTQAQFWDTWDSFWHKDDAIPVSSVEGLSSLMAGKTDNSAFNNHLNDNNAHPHTHTALQVSETNDRFWLSAAEKEIIENIILGGNGFVKNFIPSGDTVTVQVNTQYFIYEDLVVEGVLLNNGQVVVMSGAIVLQGDGEVSGTGEILLVNN